jgi:hypothetical protein
MKLENLLNLHLDGTQVGNASLHHLEGLKKLQNLDLRNTKVTSDGVKQLKVSLPTCNVPH